MYEARGKPSPTFASTHRHLWDRCCATAERPPKGAHARGFERAGGRAQITSTLPANASEQEDRDHAARGSRKPYRVRGSRVAHFHRDGRALSARATQARRLCAHPGRHTLLSRYNPSDVCGAHGGPPSNDRTRRPCAADPPLLRRLAAPTTAEVEQVMAPFGLTEHDWAGSIPVIAARAIRGQGSHAPRWPTNPRGQGCRDPTARHAEITILRFPSPAPLRPSGPDRAGGW